MKIVGNTVGTPMPRTDFTQTDPRKADYLKGRDEIATKKFVEDTIPDWAKQPTKPTYTADEVGADSKGTATREVSAHDISTASHNDIRLLITELTNRLNAFFNSDDTTLDELSEIVTYIKSNKTLIEAVTTSKVNVTDIIDNLTTNVSNKPLSAAQGVVLKGLIGELQTTVNAIKIPTKTSDLENDSKFLTAIPNEYVTESELAGKGYLTQHQDLSSYAKKTELPTKVSQLDNDSKFLTSVPSEYVTETELNAKGYLTQHQSLSDYAKKTELPTTLAELSGDPTHKTVTDAEKSTWNNKVDNSQLNTAVENALTEAKESGEFDGADGERGNSVLRITTAPSSYTTETGGFTPKYRIALSTVLSQSGADKVLVGDTILRNYYTYPVGYVDSSYVYVGAYASIRGSAGTSVTISSITESEESGGENVVTFSDDKTLTVKNGKDGADGKTPVKGTDYFTPTEKQEMVNSVIALLPKYNGGVS